MAWIGPVLSGLGAISGMLAGNKTTSTTNSTPVYDPANRSFRDSLMSMFQSNTSSTPVFNQAYRQAGLNTIARNSANAFSSGGDLLSAMGIGRTTAGANALQGNTYHAGQQVADFLNNSTLALDQRRQSLLNDAANFQSRIPVGTLTTGTGVSGQPTSPGAGAFGGFASTLAAFLGQRSANQSFANALKALGMGGNAGGGGGNYNVDYTDGGMNDWGGG